VNDTTARLVDLCARLRAVVLRALGRPFARAHAGIAVGGDFTSGIDELAEKLLSGVVRRGLRDRRTP
jgi:hypothetical protein